VTTLYWLHFIFLAALAGAVACLFWLARVHDRG
jgi:hypothetical protein